MENEPTPVVEETTTPVEAKTATPTNKKKWFIIGGIAGALVLAGIIAVVVTKTKHTEEPATRTVNTDGYVFLSMKACNTYFTDAGYNPNEVNTTCMRLEQELIAKQAAGSTNFEPMPLECNAPVEDQWYRTDDTFVIDPKNPDTMYVNIEWKGFHKSTDGGKTWELKVKNIIVDHKDVHTGKNCYGEYPVAIIDPNNSNRLLLATSGGGGGTLSDPNMRGGGVYESTDGAETWSQKISSTMNGYTTHALVFDPSNTQSFYYGTAASPASYDEADPNKIWVTKGLIYKTADNGTNWTELPTGFIKHTRLMSIMIDPRNTQKITAATSTILRNSGAPNTIADDQMGLLQTTDGGTTWKRIDNLPKYYEAAQSAKAAPKNPDHMFFIPSINGGAKPKAFYSTNQGVTWNESNKAMDLAAYDPNDATGNRMIGYMWQCYSSPTCSKTLHQSMDGGKTWVAYATLPSEAQDLGNKKSRIQNIVWHPTDKNSFYLSGANAYVWKTADNGATWTTLLTIDKIK